MQINTFITNTTLSIFLTLVITVGMYASLFQQSRTRKLSFVDILKLQEDSIFTYLEKILIMFTAIIFAYGIPVLMPTITGEFMGSVLRAILIVYLSNHLLIQINLKSLFRNLFLLILWIYLIWVLLLSNMGNDFSKLI